MNDELPLDTVNDVLDYAAKRFGDDSLEPAPLLAQLAAEGKSFRDGKRA